MLSNKVYDFCKMLVTIPLPIIILTLTSINAAIPGHTGISVALIIAGALEAAICTTIKVDSIVYNKSHDIIVVDKAEAANDGAEQ